MNHVLDLTQTQAAVAALSGLLLPLLISVVLQAHWSRKVKAAVSLAIYGGAAVVDAAVAGDLRPETWWQTAVIVFVAGVAAHRGVWEPTGTTDKIEVATSVTDPYANGPSRKPRKKKRSALP